MSMLEKLVITVPNNFYSDNDNIYQNREIKLENGITILVCCNGSGKSTFIHMIHQTCRNKNIPVWEYDNLTRGGSVATQTLLESRGDIRFLIRNIQSSEGENILNNLGDVISKLGKFVKEHKDMDKIVLTLDAIDSGLSIDGISYVLDVFTNTILPDIQKTISNVYLIVSANAYETARERNCLDVCKGQYIRFKNYEEYRDFIIESGKSKLKRYSENKS